MSLDSEESRPAAWLRSPSHLQWPAPHQPAAGPNSASDNGDPPAAASRQHDGGGDCLPPASPAASAARIAHHRPDHTATDSRPHAYGYAFCGSPAPSTASEESMNDHRDNATPPESPANIGTPSTGAPAEQIGRLSLDQAHRNHGSPHSSRGRGMLGASAVAPKRSASHELPRPQGHESQRCQYAADRVRTTQRSPRAVASKGPRRTCLDRQTYCKTSGENLQRRMIEAKSLVRPFVQSHDRIAKPLHRDSGYESLPSRQNTGNLQPTAATVSLPQTVPEHRKDEPTQRRKGLIQLPANSRYPGLILQPDSSPISQEQLGAEVKGIYAGLVMVEAKCINIDAAQAADPKSQLGPEQWQALIALHRTLLYEHHDFLMATQHPSATQALRGLATKYSMPARMWKHGIHAFLEVLRHRRPHSQDYMLAFIYLAYQMMALLLETVPSFTDTWIECLGDLARYRMAIEEEKEAHATWGGVAARWYTMASDRHPAIGRLYHHLGILERPSLRKFCLYAKSVSCVIPFPNARDSLSTLCGPIVQDEQTTQSSSHSVEARIVTYHALVYTGADQHTIDTVGNDALDLLHQQPSTLKDFGAYLAVTNIAAIFELGSPTNALFQQYATAINQAMQSSRPSMTPSALAEKNQFPPALSTTTPSPSLVSTTSFFEDTFALVLKESKSTSPDTILPYVHVMLACLHSLDNLRTRLSDGQPGHTFDSRVDTGRLAWDSLADFLNTLAHRDPISAWMLECARQRVFPAPERKEDAKPLAEDFLIRGLIWAQFYFCPGWFDGQTEDDGRAIESENTHKLRVERVLWLGLYLAFHTEPLHYDVQRKVFSAPNYVPPPSAAKPTLSDSAEVEMAESYTEQTSDVPSPRSRSSLAASSSPSSEDGFTFVKMPKPEPVTSHSWANVAAKTSNPTKARKQRPNMNTFEVADQDGMVWSAEGDQTSGYRSAHSLSTIRPGYSQ